MIENNSSCFMQENTSDEEIQTETNNLIRENGTVITRGKEHTIQCLTVIGQIEGQSLMLMQLLK